MTNGLAADNCAFAHVVISQPRRHAELALAYTEAWERGQAWQDGIRFGVGMFSKAEEARLVNSLQLGAQQIGEVVAMPFS